MKLFRNHIIILGWRNEGRLFRRPKLTPGSSAERKEGKNNNKLI
jgi:hypothetical protein